ncbi:MAG TPA: hypothetical protein VM223_11615 [Planctomycetota bacterium]|nr:hypothetical protein [Planctomycetota bacterium]
MTLLRMLAAAGCLVALFATVAPAEDDHPPIPISFKLSEPSFVTLAIEDAAGVRVRNIVSETPFPEGKHTIWWDGLDDLGRDTDAASHAIYHVPGRFVQPGTYTVRGLQRQAIDLCYEFAVYNPGNPPWRTKDRSSEWLTNHTPPCTVCFIPAGQAPARGEAGSPPQVLIGSFVAEGGSGLAWVDLDGRKLHGQMWVGGVWTGAELIARDPGPAPVPGVYAYVASAWKGDKYNNNQAEIRLHKLVNDAQKLAAPRDTRFGSGEDPRVLDPTWKFPDAEQVGVNGLAAWNGLVIISLPKLNALLAVDAAASKALGTAALGSPRGLAFDSEGRLLAVTGKTVVRIQLPPIDKWVENTTLPAPEAVIPDGLDDPQQIALGADGSIFVSDHGASNQVKVFSPAGKLVRAIGTAGTPRPGPYDPTLMHNPKGIAIDSDGKLWVAEEDHQPKRVSVWSANGKLVKAFYGPPQYGGGGVLDPEDKTLFYLRGMTFKLDWKTGESTLTAIRWRPGPDDFKLPVGHHADGPPDSPVYLGKRKYFHNAFTSNPTGGTQIACIWIERDGGRPQRSLVPVAAFGNAKMWDWLTTEPLRDKIPLDPNKKIDPDKPLDLNGFIFAWSDLNGDGDGQPDEVQVVKGNVASGVTVAADLSLVTAGAMRFAPVDFTRGGAPVYALDKPEILCPGTQGPRSSGGGQVLLCRDGWTVLTTPPKPFAPESVGAARNGTPMWSYPSLWPGLHASHIAPPPEFPGELIGTTRLLGPAFIVKDKRTEFWAVNGNKGTMYLFTTDGLFVATLFQDTRTPNSSWAERPKAERGMSVSDLTNNEESFWPSITRTSDRKVYVVTNYPAIIRVDGLDTVRRIKPQRIDVTAEQLEQARAYHVAVEARRQAESKTQTVLAMPIIAAAPAVDGDLAEWKPEQFVTIDVRQKQVGDWGRRKLETQAALAISGDMLYGTVRTGEPRALDNDGSSPQNLFKTGGAIDLMLGTDPIADPARKQAVAGDLRLLIAQVRGKGNDVKTLAMLYRPVVPGHAGDKVPFSSPLRTIAFDDVRDVSADVTLAQGKPSDDKTVVPNPGGDFEFSIPLSVIGLKPAPGMKIRGDVGVLRGSGIQTTQRAYWTNKAAGLVSDIPSEAELIPRLWGWVEVRGE